MKTLTLAAIASLTLALGALTSGCGLAAAFVDGYNSGAAGSAPVGTGDCKDAVKVCEDFVATVCDRADTCGTESFDACVNELTSDKLPCERADAADDFSACDADLEQTSCSDLEAQRTPASCSAPQIHFSNTEVCR